MLKMKLFLNFKSDQMDVPVLLRKQMPITYIHKIQYIIYINKI
ncbi:hypothetical protein LMANV2_200028 [Leptospira interrogans serovar Manilae]|uniref:Uncharacterized protein n=1 Tax=Leptospira interrogans serovar Manilae TaxID=214675 RepID=A0AAQ1SN54_LEPIR|nr:hypothetical protein LMANV2_200028 [Leptospira interrogans serovar Manilae]